MLITSILEVIYGASPSNACSALTNSPRPENPGMYLAIVVMERGLCTFETKVQNAQAAGFNAVIVYDNEENEGLVTSKHNSEVLNIFMLTLIY